MIEQLSHLSFDQRSNNLGDDRMYDNKTNFFNRRFQRPKKSCFVQAEISHFNERLNDFGDKSIQKMTKKDFDYKRLHRSLYI